MPPQDLCGVQRLVVLDRVTDLVTPCMTQLTYSGLVAEMYVDKRAGGSHLVCQVIT